MRSRNRRSGSSGAFDRASIATNATDQTRGGGEQHDRLRGSPAVLGRVRHRIDEQHQAARDRGRTGQVEMAVRDVGAALADELRREHEHGDADRHVDEEDPRPTERARERAAEEHAGRCAAAGDRAPDAEREVPLLSFLERGRQDRERRRREQGSTEPLGGAERDQRAFRPGEPVQQRADGEKGEAGHEQAPPAEQVRHSSAKQQHAAEQDRVRGHHPLQALLAEAEVGLDRRQGDVHDRDVEHHHELGRHDHGKGDPTPPVRRRR